MIAVIAGTRTVLSPGLVGIVIALNVWSESWKGRGSHFWNHFAINSSV